MTRGFPAGLVLLSFFVLVGCASRPPPLAPEPEPLPPPLLAISAEKMPVAIEKLVASQRDELESMNALANVVGDTRGRVRAKRDVEVLANEFVAIVGSGGGRTDSDSLDDVVQKLLALDTKIVLLHDTLRTANPDPGNPKTPD